MHDWKYLIFYKKNKLSNPIIPRRDSESPKKGDVAVRTWLSGRCWLLHPGDDTRMIQAQAGPRVHVELNSSRDHRCCEPLDRRIERSIRAAGLICIAAHTSITSNYLSIPSTNEHSIITIIDLWLVF
jgi:hypothetical protein